MRKETIKYFFSVEGDTERWYLNWLQTKINSNEYSRYNIKIDCKRCSDPRTYVKNSNILKKTEVTHLVDIESYEDSHIKRFECTLDNMKEAQKMGKDIRYVLGYSNFTFELWMILHKYPCNKILADRTQYLEFINKAYNENFKSLKKFKNEKEFHRILSNLTLDDVKDAINRAKSIMSDKSINGLIEKNYKGYKYYVDNPSLSIYKSIEKILTTCEII